MEEKKKLYFIGIAGQAMSGIAVAAKQKGLLVTGVAVGAYPPATDALAKAGIHYHTAYDAQHIESDCTVVLGNGVAADNPELLQAQELGVTVLSFPELLAEWTAKQRRIVVAGTHGKTTTSTFIAWLLECASVPVDFIIGMPSIDFGVSARHLDAPVVVLEGDEYSSSALDNRSKFSHYQPDILVLTSLEWDHPDLFPTFADMRQRFSDLIAGLPVDGVLIANADIPEVVDLSREATCQVILYSGRGAEADYIATDIDFTPHETHFRWLVRGADQGMVTMALAGQHNVDNALAALAAATACGVSAEKLTSGLLSYRGAQRRFELIGTVNGVAVIDDYAHHPTEVAATLAAARLRYPDGKIWAYFKPHTYSRTKALLAEIGQAFASADVVLIDEIEGAREGTGAQQLSNADVVAQLPRDTSQIHYLVDGPRARQLITENVTAGDTVVCMSVGGSDHLAAQVLAGLRLRWPAS